MTTVLHPPHAHPPIWLHLRRDSEDDARDTFKTLKNQLLGESNAHLYHAWAALEAQSGNVSRALGILHKGLKEGAQPAG